MPVSDLLHALPDDTRGRLLAGLAMAIVEKGYGATTIADIVRHARVSKRTFYEHFADKEACYLELYEVASDHMLAIIAEAASAGDAPWRKRLDGAARAYLTELSAAPALTRTFLMEIQAAGPRALRLRREVHGRFADQLRALTEHAARDEEGMRPLSPALATAIVGGINELMLMAVEQGETQRLADLTDTASELILAAVAAPTPSRIA